MGLSTPLGLGHERGEVTEAIGVGVGAGDSIHRVTAPALSQVPPGCSGTVDVDQLATDAASASDPGCLVESGPRPRDRPRRSRGRTTSRCATRHVEASRWPDERAVGAGSDSRSRSSGPAVRSGGSQRRSNRQTSTRRPPSATDRHWAGDPPWLGFMPTRPLNDAGIRSSRRRWPSRTERRRPPPQPPAPARPARGAIVRSQGLRVTPSALVRVYCSVPNSGACRLADGDAPAEQWRRRHGSESSVRQVGLAGLVVEHVDRLAPDRREGQGPSWSAPASGSGSASSANQPTSASRAGGLERAADRLAVEHERVQRDAGEAEAQAVEHGDEPHDLAVDAGLLAHLLHRHLGRRVADVGPARRVEPHARVGPLHEQDLAVVVADHRADGDLRRHVAGHAVADRASSTRRRARRRRSGCRPRRACRPRPPGPPRSAPARRGSR